MPGNHSEISVAEQNSVDNNNNNTTRRRKKKKQKQKKDHDHEHDDDDDEVRISDEANRIVTPSIRKRFIDKVRKKPKSAKPSSSSSGSRKGGCFSVISKRRTEDDDDDDPLSDPNDESFTHEMLRVMLETNDFFCDDCNPHI